MKTLKIGVILLALLLVGMMIVPMVSAADSTTKAELLKKVSAVHFTPSKEFTNYMNAPVITEKQKTDALTIASDSMSGITAASTSSITETNKKFGDYVNGEHGPINVYWVYPYSGNI